MRIASLLILFLVTASIAQADVLVFANDYAGFVQAAGPLSVIDFETLPNGQPATAGTAITPSFNYDLQGAHFTVPLGILRIAGNSTSGHDLRVTVPFGQHTWITADLITPAYAVGAHFPGTMTLCAYELDGSTLGCVSYSSGGSGFFVGIVSTTPISRAVFDRGSSISAIQDFQFSPIPEPAGAALLAAGAGWLACGRRRRI